MRALYLAVLPVAAFCACSGVDPDPALPPVTLRSVLISFEVQTIPLEGVKVCVFERSNIPCVESDSKGRAVLTGVPADSEVAVSYRRNDLYPGLRMFTTPTTDPMEAAYLLPLRSTVEERFSAAGVPPDPETGSVLFDAYTSTMVPGGIAPRAEGVRMRVEPNSGVEFYLDEDTFPNTELEGTSPAGLGGYMNVSPGVVELTFEKDGAMCSEFPGGFSWKGAASNNLRAQVVPGYLTFAGGVICR